MSDRKRVNEVQLPAIIENPVVEVLKDARKLVSKRSRWTQYILKKRRFFIGPMAYCAVGALDHAAGNKLDDQYGGAVRALVRTLNRRGDYSSISEFNDRSTHAEVLALFDETIAHEENKLCG